MLAPKPQATLTTMFRRKTDQVYATLQQVQRRLTDATQAGDEGEIFGARPKPPPPMPSDPLRAATAQAQAVNGIAPTVPVNTPPPSPPTASFHRRNSLQFSGELATVLFLLWVVTLTAAFFIGKHVGGRVAATADPGAGYASGDAGSRQARPVSASVASGTSASVAPAGAGGHVLVIQSVARATADSESKMGALARQLNDFAEKNPGQGFKAWFAVRRPDNGGLQLVFGLVDGRFGIDKEGFTTLADTFDRAGYKDAHWIRVDGK